MRVFGYNPSIAQLSAYISFLIAAPVSGVCAYLDVGTGEASFPVGMLYISACIYSFFVLYLPRFIVRNLDKDACLLRGRRWCQRF